MNSLSGDPATFPERLLNMLEELASRDPAMAMALVSQWRKELQEEVLGAANLATDLCAA